MEPTTVIESQQVHPEFLQYRWYRIESGNNVCSIHPTEVAVLQCSDCSKTKGIPKSLSYFCSNKCYLHAWPNHRSLHEWAAIQEGAASSSGNRGQGTAGPSGLHPFITATHDICFEVGQQRSYTPTAADIGHILRFECGLIHPPWNKELANLPLGNRSTVLTSRVLPPIAQPSISFNTVSGGQNPPSALSYLSYNIDGQSHFFGTFLLKADLICLQQVREEHFHDIFMPEFNKLGFDGVFLKNSSTEGFGLVTLFCENKFSLVRKEESYKTAQILLLESDSGYQLVLVNTHDFPEEENAQLLNELGEFRLPILLCGDIPQKFLKATHALVSVSDGTGDVDGTGDICYSADGFIVEGQLGVRDCLPHHKAILANLLWKLKSRI